MLLPSALSCDSRQHHHHHHNHHHSSSQQYHSHHNSRFLPTRLFPTTPPSPSLSPSPSTSTSISAPTTNTASDGLSFIASTGLLGTCRALQSLLNSSSTSSSSAPSSHRGATHTKQAQAHAHAQTQTQTQTQRLQSPLHLVRPAPARAHRVVKRQAQTKRQKSVNRDRDRNKRRRDVYEGDGERGDGFCTPKRPRRMAGVQEEMPLGIGRAEVRVLEALREEEEGDEVSAGLRSGSGSGSGSGSESESLARVQSRSRSPEKRRRGCTVGNDEWCRCHGPGTGADTRLGDVKAANDNNNDANDDDDYIYSLPSSPTTTNTTTNTNTTPWTTADDNRLVSLVLQKLKLSRRDWTECARRMGKEHDHDSVGRRWRALVGEGNVGLRRGRGRICEGWRC
ncbi:hypothetical protein GX51_04906 [Blastomyces parvus]|uniref:Myb-like domain-containing protein n=1 Tax=Blastomyces parvus TaxID=2060905 RepID=A0A2B7WRG7_9EURO|nr:hypothetical protein GX51_04906 [Blastomyces parvus]